MRGGRRSASIGDEAALVADDRFDSDGRWLALLGEPARIQDEGTAARDEPQNGRRAQRRRVETRSAPASPAARPRRRRACIECGRRRRPPPCRTRSRRDGRVRRCTTATDGLRDPRRPRRAGSWAARSCRSAIRNRPLSRRLSPSSAASQMRPAGLRRCRGRVRPAGRRRGNRCEIGRLR